MANSKRNYQPNQLKMTGGDNLHRWHFAPSEFPRYSTFSRFDLEVWTMDKLYVRANRKVRLSRHDGSELIQTPYEHTSHFEWTKAHFNWLQYLEVGPTYPYIEVRFKGSYRDWYTQNVIVDIDYEPSTYEAKANIIGKGTVNGVGRWNLEPSKEKAGPVVDGMQTYTYETTVMTRTLTAKPAEGYRFDHWELPSGQQQDSPSLTITFSDETINAHETIENFTAVFVEEKKSTNIWVGDKPVKQLYLGTQPIKKIYKGSTLVYG